MEAEVKQVIKEKEYVHDENHDKYASKGLAGTALGFGIGGAVLGAAALWGRRGGIGGGMPETLILTQSVTLFPAVPVLLLPLFRRGRKVAMRL